ncbi:MAG: glycoside hydrolase family 3 C-terminal domain-containing protein [Bacilli bacterium]|nr:glycoside hydrolase family 3 C-terminal domain-containing protein [Bacilli bacterium]
MKAKKLLKKSVIAWGITTVVLSAVLAVANVVCRNELDSLLNSVFGGKRAIVSQEDTGIVFEQEYFSKKDANAHGNAVVEKICEEGMVLLKNEKGADGKPALPLKAKAKVSVFGKNSVKLVTGGSGSACPGDAEPKTIYESLKAAGFETNEALEKFYKDNSKSGKGRSENPPMENGGVKELETGETPIASYPSSVTDTFSNYGDAALVVFSRIAGENWDLPRKASDSADRHYLELDNNERALLKYLCDSNKFQHIVVLLNGSNYIDLGFLKMTNDPAYNNKIDACINIGSVGGNGIMALGRILNGTANPSGHTVDTVYTHYENDPTWQNFGNYSTYLNPEGAASYISSTGKATGYYTVSYEEGIYLGYRYYETRGHIDGENWYNQNVVYPFGYGLSYTTFSQELVGKDALAAAALNATEKFDVKVKVKNTGDVAGKQVVQLYAEAPYTAGGIEKAYKVLVGFAKTKLLAKGEEQELTISVNPYDFASYDAKDMNANGFKGYELDAGNYTFHLGTDAHTDFDTFTKTLATGHKFENDTTTNNKVENLFDDVTEGVTENLSRDNFTGTFPHEITTEERTITTAFRKKLDSLETTNDEVYTTLPTMGKNKGNPDEIIKLKALVGKAYNDPLWEDFLDQFEFAEMLKLFNDGCYSTTDIERLGVPATSSFDGPTGLVSFLAVGATQPAVYGGTYYQSECLLAQTYNLELAAEQAKAIGNECLVGNERGNGLSYPGWYAPGVNLHRSPFSGRNTEYYSEDPFISGKMAATVIKGVQELGVYANVKHFAVNDQETYRCAKGIATWVNEQALRELYLKPFEFAVKEGKSHGLMTSFNRIGTEWAGGSYRLCTTILRNEWGFQGSVICDFDTHTYMDAKQMLYAGGDLSLSSLNADKLQTSNIQETPFVTPTDPKDANLLRRATHNNCYAIGNSNIMAAEILGYLDPIWQIALTGLTIGLGSALLVWGGLVITFALLKKEENAEANA